MRLRVNTFKRNLFLKAGDIAAFLFHRITIAL